MEQEALRHLRTVQLANRAQALISGSTNSRGLHCFAGARGICVCRALLNSQGRQMFFEAAEVSELFSWLLRLPKDRERGWASNDEFNPALFEVPGRNSQH